MVLIVEKGFLFFLRLVKATIRTSLLNAQITHNPPSVKGQLVPKPLKKLSVLQQVHCHCVQVNVKIGGGG